MLSIFIEPKKTASRLTPFDCLADTICHSYLLILSGSNFPYYFIITNMDTGIATATDRRFRSTRVFAPHGLNRSALTVD